MSYVMLKNTALHRLSLSGLIYSLRHFNRTLTPIWNKTRENIKKDKSNNYINVLRPYLHYFNYYNRVYNYDWQHIVELNSLNKSRIIQIFKKSLIDDVYYFIYNDLNKDFKPAISNKRLKQYIQEVNTTMEFNINKYVETKESNKGPHVTQHIFPRLYEYIELDNNEIYNLRLVCIPAGAQTSIHNHNGLCIYKLLNYQRDNPILRETNYVNYTYDDENLLKNKTTRFIENDVLNILYFNEFHQLESLGDDCYCLNLYFHDLNIHRANNDIWG